jgi:hypothetical protein
MDHPIDPINPDTHLRSPLQRGWDTIMATPNPYLPFEPPHSQLTNQPITHRDYPRYPDLGS